MEDVNQTVRRDGSGYLLTQRQTIPADLKTTFEFFSDPYNLEEITPDRLQFNILDCEPLPVTDGTKIHYSLNIWGIPITWISEITRWNPPHDFRDVMKRGPYRTWQHTHRFEESGDETVMTDEVYYELPFGVLGRLFGGWLVRWDVSSIFSYRAKKFRTILS